MKKNIVLVGMMGSGKTTAAKVLAERTHRRLVSTDEMVEHRAGQKVKDIVAKHGWDHFRKLESSVVEEISQQHGLVIDCGGGVVLDRQNLKWLKVNGIVFYLDAPPDVLYERIKNDSNRPLIQVANPQAELEKIYAERFPLYSQADFTIDASDQSIDVPVAQILKKL
jgi:shikimate kinase